MARLGNCDAEECVGRQQLRGSPWQLLSVRHAFIIMQNARSDVCSNARNDAALMMQLALPSLFSLRICRWMGNLKNSLICKQAMIPLAAGPEIWQDTAGQVDILGSTALVFSKCTGLQIWGWLRALIPSALPLPYIMPNAA
eukprot:1143607-Pelagomonas_calceolata.AAC.5